jgi:hypothetical protein
LYIFLPSPVHAQPGGLLMCICVYAKHVIDFLRRLHPPPLQHTHQPLPRKSIAERGGTSVRYDEKPNSSLHSME